jgi:UDP-3-O-[3-hydroxymyristoyl] glucosamine N-acyltransferase LpxD
MRFRDGFSLDELPDLRSLFLNASVDFETPGSSRRFLSRRFFLIEDPERGSGESSLVLVGSGTRLEARASLRAGLVLAEEGVEGLPESIPVLRIRSARQALTLLIRALSGRIEREAPEYYLEVAGDMDEGMTNDVHPSAVVEGVLEGDVTVGALAHVAAGSFVGRGSRIEAGAIIHAHCHLGPRTVVQSGAVIGPAGFGFFTGETARAHGLVPVPHEAGVLIGADCFIGANTVVAAGVLHPTEIGEGCKLDSHVQIAHNVRLGARSLMASQSGIAGSTVVGEGFRMGGAASVSGHLRIGRNVSVAAKSGVTKDVPDNAVVAGFPARPIAEWRKEQIKLRNAK